MARINLRFVDELISARKALHGGERGAPVKLEDGSREGQALNRSVVAMTSATLQAFCEDCFFEISKAKLALSDEQQEAYRKLYSQWGNPSQETIIKHFRRLGVIDALHGVSWQACSNRVVRQKLKDLNELRNQIAHGRAELMLGNGNARRVISLSLATATMYRNFAEKFAERFDLQIRALAGID